MREAGKGARGRPRHGRVLRESARGRVRTSECSQGQARGFNDFVLCENPDSDVVRCLKPDSDVTNQLQATFFQSGFSNPVESVIDLTLHTPNPKVNVNVSRARPLAQVGKRRSITARTRAIGSLVSGKPKI